MINDGQLMIRGPIVNHQLVQQGAAIILGILLRSLFRTQSIRTTPDPIKQQPNTPIIPYTLHEPTSRNVSDVEDGPATSPQSKQQNIACGVGPASITGRNTRVGRIFSGTESEKNAWPFMVNTDVK